MKLLIEPLTDESSNDYAFVNEERSLRFTFDYAVESTDDFIVLHNSDGGSLTVKRSLISEDNVSVDEVLEE